MIDGVHESILSDDRYFILPKIASVRIDRLKVSISSTSESRLTSRFVNFSRCDAVIIFFCIAFNSLTSTLLREKEESDLLRGKTSHVPGRCFGEEDILVDIMVDSSQLFDFVQRRRVDFLCESIDR